MASNLSSIGFAFEDGEAFAAAMVRLASEAVERLETEVGSYAIWRSRTGAEIWFQIARGEEGAEAEIIGLTPFYEGKSDIALQVTESVRRPDDSHLEGALTGWVSPDEDGEGVFPLVFDAADFAAQAERPLPEVRRARLTGFAREVTAFPSAEAYYARATRDPELADQCFIPIGLFSAAMQEREAGDPPSSAALLTGRVVEHARLVNETSGRPFHWLLVDSLGLTIDIVADPEAVSGEIVAGGTVEVTCLLIGRTLA